MNRTTWTLLLLAAVAACDSKDSSDREHDHTSEAGSGSSSKASESAAGKEADEAPKEDTAPKPAEPEKPRISETAIMNSAAVHGQAAEPIAENCRGLNFDGMIYSPGGATLPNKCAPYHPTSNNPYAVRCIDAWSWYKTKFPGDQYCILPPPPDKGLQYGVHPQGKAWFEQVSKGDMSGYENLSGEWLMDSGEEEQANYNTGAYNPEAKNYYRNQARMRPGSHHMIVSSSGGEASETWGPALMTGLVGGTNLPGAQRPDENSPKSLNKPEEDDGLYSKIPANAPVTFNMHHFNATDSTILKEAWTNLWFEDDARVETRGILGLNPLQAVTLNISPGSTVDLHYSFNIQQPVRVVTLFGHRHAWTSNFSTWVEEPDGKLDIVYQSFAWLDEPTYRYDSVTQNPTPSPDARTDGASSGIRMLMPGQKLHFNCHIEFTDERAKSEGAPSPASVGPLRFANEAFTAEMCILFGTTTGTMLLAPDANNSPVPDFAKMK